MEQRLLTGLMTIPKMTATAEERTLVLWTGEIKLYEQSEPAWQQILLRAFLCKSQLDNSFNLASWNPEQKN